MQKSGLGLGKVE